MELVELTRRLIAIRTVNPPGGERACADFIAPMLADAGLAVRTYEFAPERTSLVATLAGDGSRPALAFTGHLDVVPLGAAPWSHDPFAGEVHDGRLYGRGSADMKGAVAAMILTAQAMAQIPHRRSDLHFILTAGEELGCLGAQHLAQTAGALSPAGALVVGEPTGNRPLIAHKGCTRFELTARGVTAHASMPEQGDNAIYKMAEAVLALRAFAFGVADHPLLGRPTLNVGTIRGGLNVNSVPDAASIGVDIRTVPGQSQEEIRKQLRSAVGADIEIVPKEAGDAVSSDAAAPWIVATLAAIQSIQGVLPEVGSAPYFTDAGYLKPALGDPPTLILGPGEAEVAHKTDEYCGVDKLEESLRLYKEIALQWCSGDPQHA